MANILDDSWVKSAFLLPSNQIMGGNQAAINRIYSTSMQKASDTTLGGNFIINPLPQFTRYCDLKHNILSNPGGRGNTTLVTKVSRTNGTASKMTNGMGRVYSEKFDDNMQVVHFRCGFPQFNSLTSFYANYYSVPAASMARSGRAPGFFYTLGHTIGTVATIPLLPFIMVSKVIKFFLRRPASKYYYLKPSMLPYWTAVSSMVNGIAANMGIIPRPISAGTKALYEKGSDITKADVKAYHNLIPSIYRENGGIDVFAVAQRGQALVNERRKLLDGQLNAATSRDEIQAIFKKRLYGSDMSQVYANVNKVGNNYEAYVKIWKESEMMGAITDEDARLESNVEKTGRLDEGYFNRIWESVKAEGRMGSEFVSFRVDYTGTQSESFSNGTKDSSVQRQINDISASARETRFSMFDGNLDSAGVASSILGTVKDVFSGVADGLGIQGLAQLAGSAFVDIPKVWDSSSCEFNKLSLTIPLRSPYGDPLSRLQNLILPLSCLFAMAVPLATGKQSHTSPFLVEYFAQGRAHSRLAIVDSLTVTRGVGDVGWNNNGGPLGIDIQLGLLDLTNAINMPLNPEFSLTDTAIQAAGYAVGSGVAIVGGGDSDTGGNIGTAIASGMLGSTYDDDNNYTDYLSILAGIGLEAELNPSRKWNIRLAQQQTRFDDATSPARQGMWAMSGNIGEVVKAVSLATDRG